MSDVDAGVVVELLEMTDATALLTTDIPLAGAAGPACRIELLR